MKPLKINLGHRKNYNFTFTLSLICFYYVSDSEVAQSMLSSFIPFAFVSSAFPNKYISEGDSQLSLPLCSYS